MQSTISTAKPGIILKLALVALVALLLSACGGGSATIPVDDSGNQDTVAPGGGGQQDTTPPTGGGTGVEDSGAPAGGGGSPVAKFGTMLPLGSPLPEIPTEDLKAPAKTVSTILDYPGADFMLAAGGTVDGDDLVLESSDEFTAWAMYRADGLGGLDIEVYSIEALPGELGQNYEVAFSNFDTNDWLFLINSTLPEAQVNLAEAEGTFISALGNLYFLVTVEGGDSVRISMSHLLTADEGPNDPPDDPPLPFTFIGPLLELGNSAFSISDEQGAAITFSYDDDTMWFSEFGEPISPETLEPGDLLLVDALETPAGWYAIGVMLIEQGRGKPGDPNDPVFLEGEIVSIGNGVLKLAPQEVVVNYNEETEWFNDNGPAGPEDFAPGDYVLIDAVELDSGLLALTVFGIRLDDPADPRTPITYIGNISELGPEILVLEQGVSFIHTADTLWLINGTEGGPEDFAVGDFVQVDGVETDNGNLALMVTFLGRNGDPGGGADVVYITGQIDEIGNLKIFLIDGTSMDYNEFTNWFDELGLPIGPDGFAHGDWVFIEALAFTDEWLAANVYKLPGDPNGGGGDPGR